jgi:ferredoxin
MPGEFTSQQVKQAAMQAGADLVGIAPVDRFRGQPPQHHPQSIFPECRSVIVLARRVLRGAVRGVEEGTNFGSTYGYFGFRWLEDNFLSQTTYDLTCLVEASGFEAVPLFGYTDAGLAKGRPVAPGKPAPDVIVDIQFAAQAAGLGEIGLGDFFLTRRFGTRQRFALILTDAELEGDPVLPRTLCGDCGRCAAACPLGAMDLGRTHAVGVEGSQAKVAAIDYEVCAACPNGAMRGPGRGSRPDRIAAACGRACLVALEQAGKLDNQFAAPFRKRAAWALDMLQRPIASAQGAPTDIGCGKNVDTIGQQRRGADA